jgi:hypothetical protein
MRRKLAASSRRGVVAGDARVVDQDVQLACLACGIGYARRVGDVEDEQPGVATDLPGGAFSARGVTGADPHGETFCGWRAISLPIPLLAPVTSATEFSMPPTVPAGPSRWQAAAAFKLARMSHFADHTVARRNPVASTSSTRSSLPI